MTTADEILRHLDSYDLKDNGQGQYRCNSPLRPGSNSHGFTIRIDSDGEHGAYHDHVSGDKGSLYALASKLGIVLPERSPAAQTKRTYGGLADYAGVHGVETAVFEAAGWEEVTHEGRLALRFKTSGGLRYRYLDGETPHYKSEKGYERCWYGLKRAIALAAPLNYLVICNGEASTIVAQHYGVPAFCMTAGENQNIPDNLRDELSFQWDELLYIALDCDKTGREGATKFKTVFTEAVIIDLGLTDGGDLADFCTLHAEDSPVALEQRCVPVQIEPEETLLVFRSDALAEYITRLSTSSGPARPPLRNPIAAIQCLGGQALVLEPGEMVGVIGSSGTGKTTVLENLVSVWLQQAKNVLLLSPEHKARRFADRDVQRYGHFSRDDMALWELYKWEQQQGIQNTTGLNLPEAARHAAADSAETLADWPGKLGQIKADLLTVDQLNENLPRYLDAMKCDVSALVVDYAQLLEALDTADVSMYRLMMRLKLRCEALGLVIVVATQTTKQDTRDQSRVSRLLDSSSARWINEDAFKLMFSINPEKMNDTGFQHTTGVLNVCKNSDGKQGKVRVYIDWTKRRWILDKAYPNQDMSLYEKGSQ